LEEALARFDRLRPANARRLVKFYQKRFKQLVDDPEAWAKEAPAGDAGEMRAAG
jgi:hypothetical protein